MTTKLIDGNALADRLLSDAITDDQRRVANLIAKVIEEMPEAVVRCGECAKCQNDQWFHDYWCDGRKVWKDHYCGYGVRKK